MIKLNQDLNNFNQNNSNEQNSNNFSPTNSTINTAETTSDNNSVNNNQVEVNDISSINNTSLDNSKSTNMNILKKICMVLSIIVAIIGGGIGIFSIIASYTMDSIEFFGPLLNIFAFLGGIVFFIYTGIIIGVIWIIYGIIKFISNFYTKLSTTNKKIFKIFLIIVIVLLLIVSFSIKKYNYDNKNLMEVLNEPPDYDFYDKTTYYFIYKDKIYYYKLDPNSNFTKYYDRLFVMNLDGTNNKKLAETDELRYAIFYFVYNDEAYYYTTYYDENKKINLKTGEINSLGTNDIYLAKTLNNGIIYSFIDNAIAGDSYSIFKKIDIKNNKTISEVKTKYSMAGNVYYFDYDGGNIYYLEDFYSKYPSIYKNNEIIYEFTEYDRYDFPKIEFIAVNNDYIYFKQNNDIYKLSISNKSIEKELSNDLSDIKRISSGNNTDNYFYSNKKIYSFDMKKDTFELVISNIEKQPEYIYNINNNLIFIENTDNMKYYSETDNLGSVVIYNKLNSNTEIFDNIRKVSFDEEYMYLLKQTDNNYSVKKIKLYS